MPSAVAIGNMIGAKISTTDVASMKLPATSSTRFSMIRNAHGGSPRSVIHCSHRLRHLLRRQHEREQSTRSAMMNISIAVTFAASAITRGTSRKPTSR